MKFELGEVAGLQHMAISYHVNGKAAGQLPRPMRVIIMINATFAAAMLSAWTYVAVYVSQPIAWATWFTVYRTGEILDIFDYPFILLWGLPFGAILAAWLAERLSMRGLAYTCVTIPVLMHGTIFAWFYLAPPEWR